MDSDKHIDESWKESASQEREISGEIPQDSAEFEVTFLNYITSLMYQAMVFLGEIPNPVSNQAEVSLPQAKLLIDTLALLREKTKGNLEKQEEDMLNAAVYELQMKFVEISRSTPQL